MQELNNVLTYIQACTGIGFSVYTQTFIDQYLTDRMHACCCMTPEAYLDGLERNPAAVDHFLNLLLNVHTEFFRHPLTFEFLDPVTDSRSRIKALNLGADAFFSKPIDEARIGSGNQGHVTR